MLTACPSHAGLMLPKHKKEEVRWRRVRFSGQERGQVDEEKEYYAKREGEEEIGSVHQTWRGSGSGGGR